LPRIRDEFGCKIVGATLGDGGALAWDGRSLHYVPAFDIQAVDTTGAGDLFHAGFIYAFLRGQPLEECMRFACAAAAINCTASGARGGIRPVSEIESLITKNATLKPFFSGDQLRSATEQHATSRPDR
jgi:sulfofructose kinase